MGQPLFPVSVFQKEESWQLVPEAICKDAPIVHNILDGDVFPDVFKTGIPDNVPDHAFALILIVARQNLSRVLFGQVGVIKY